MKKIISIATCALLLTVSAMARDSASVVPKKSAKPRLVVFVVGGMPEAQGDMVAILIGNELSSGDRYEIITRNSAVQKKLKELREYESGGQVDDGDLIEWGRQNNVSRLCVVTATLFGDEYMFAAQLTDVKSNQQVGSADYTSSGSPNSTEIKKVASAIAGQLQRK
jgi:hypothetical protein